MKPRSKKGGERTQRGAASKGRAAKGGLAPKKGAPAPKKGAPAPKKGATAPKKGATAPKKGATAPKKAAPARPKAPARFEAARRAPREPEAVEVEDEQDEQDEQDALDAELDEVTAEASRPAPSHGIVALVGRPNVGKSTIFNRLVGRRVAIVHDEPGVTRDRHYADVSSRGKRFTLVDTGGFDPHSDDPMRQGIKRQVEIAIAEADVIVCVLDASQDASAADHAEIDLLRRAGKPVIFVANKADTPGRELEAASLYRLGMEKIVPISALHGRGFGELEAAIGAALPAEPPEASGPDPEGAIRVAVIGKPNAGKSSLINRLVGEPRLLVDDRPGTTRDPIDLLVERDGKKFLFVDTAGIRRKAKVTKASDVVEGQSVMQAIRAMERCEVVLLLCDAAEGVAEQDAKIAGLAVDRNRAVVIGLNKMDLLEKKSLTKAEEDARDKLSFLTWAPVVTLSGKTGRGLKTTLETLARVSDRFRRRVPTGELNRFFEQVLATRPPPTSGGRAPRLYYITQAEAAPPLFVVVASDPEKLHFSYRRYVQNQIRKAFDLEGVPVRIKYKPRRKRDLRV